jgi:hypothetical protein
MLMKVFNSSIINVNICKKLRNEQIVFARLILFKLKCTFLYFALHGRQNMPVQK